jgi:acyl-CoA synthetase (AMP-forming)/AMP-acid ligase II
MQEDRNAAAGLLDTVDLIEVTTIGDLLLRAARRWPGRDAVILPDERVTYRELAARAIDRARGLMALGLNHGEHVAMLLPTSMAFLEVFFGIALAGGVPVPINARYRGGELRYLVENSDATIVVTTGEIGEGINLFERLSEGLGRLQSARDGSRLAMPDLPGLRSIVMLGERKPNTIGDDAFQRRAAEVSFEAVAARRAQVRLRDTGLLLYTSGTTSNPKGCMLSHEAVVRNGQTLASRYRLAAEDGFWSPLPMYHIAGIMPIAATFATGGRYVTLPYFEIGAALRQMREERITVNFACFAPIIAELINHREFGGPDFASTRLMNSSLVMQPPSFQEALARALPDAIQTSTYGLSEAAGTVSTSRLDDSLERRTTRLGGVMPGLEVRIADEFGEPLPTGRQGEILIRGYSIADGYYKDPVKTAATLRGGWLRTGDVGSLDEAGHLMFHGRTKEMLKVGGENVAALEIEVLVGNHPAVKLCQVVGCPDPRLVEVPAAFVELKADMRASEREIIDFCVGKIASFKVPRYVRFVTEWPLGASKIQKFKLRDQLLEELGLADAAEKKAAGAESPA